MKRKSIDPKTLKKHTDVVRKHDSSIKIAGERVLTKTGYTIKGTACKDFETYFEVIVENSSTDKFLHSKKTRSYRVLSGQGTLILEVSGDVKTVSLIPGDEVSIPPGTTYSIYTGSLMLEMFVSQAYNYNARLNVVDSMESKDINEDLLTPISREELLETTLMSSKRRQGSKAADQQRALALARGRFVESVATGTAAPDSANLKPTFGRDLDMEGAG